MTITPHVLQIIAPLITKAMTRQAEEMKSEGGKQAELAELLLEARAAIKALINAYVEISNEREA